MDGGPTEYGAGGFGTPGDGIIALNYDPAATVDDGNWNYIAVVANGAASKIHWYNSSGVLSSSSNFTLGAIVTGTVPITIGGRYDASDALIMQYANDRNFEGSIDEVMYHAKALSADEILQNYQYGEQKHE
jgi:hypothetical protein